VILQQHRWVGRRFGGQDAGSGSATGTGKLARMCMRQRKCLVSLGDEPRPPAEC